MNCTQQAYINRNVRERKNDYFYHITSVLNCLSTTARPQPQLPSPIRQIVGSGAFGDCMSRNKFDHTTNGIKHQQPIALVDIFSELGREAEYNHKEF